MELRARIGTCLPVFLIAILLDVLGLVLLFVGIFANLRISGRFYGDFLIYSGSIIIFLSLFLWLMWYVGNLRVAVDVGGAERSSSIARLARKLTERLSRRLAGEGGASRVMRDERTEPQAGSEERPAKASRVTWGRSTVYHNQGYDDSLDSPAEERPREHVDT
ncbi:transmembrane protein 238 [Synchiropus picturatus]